MALAFDILSTRRTPTLPLWALQLVIKPALHLFSSLYSLIYYNGNSHALTGHRLLFMGHLHQSKRHLRHHCHQIHRRHRGRKFFDFSWNSDLKIDLSDGIPDANEAFDWGHDSKLTDDPNDTFIDPYMRVDNPWPTQLPGFEAHLSEYYRTMGEFCRVLAKAVALSLGLQESHFDEVLTHPGCNPLVAHYPPQGPQSGNLGLSAHTGAECKTALPLIVDSCPLMRMM